MSKWMLVLAMGFYALAQERITPESLWNLGRVSGGAVSPDGKWVLYGVRTTNLAENSSDQDLYLVATSGGDSRALTSGKGSESDFQWVRSAEGDRVYFLSAKSGSSQAWKLDPAGGDPMQVTDIEGGIANLKVSPKGDALLFTRDVRMDPTLAELHPDLPKADAKIIDSLYFRHWDQWEDGAYSHAHVAKLGADGKAQTAFNLMEGHRRDCPLPPFGGAEQLAWAPEGNEVALTLKLGQDQASSTDSGIYLRGLNEGGRLELVTGGMPGYDVEPSYSPDGKWLAWLSMPRAGFEADKNRILVMDRKTRAVVDLTDGFDRTAHGLHWMPDSQSLVFHVEDLGTDQVYRVKVTGGSPEALTQGQADFAVAGIHPDGGSLIVTKQDMLRPIELHRLDLADKKLSALTWVNDAMIAKLAAPRVEPRWTKATDGHSLHSWVIYPPDFDPKKKWPVLLYCQGGPQSQVGQWFSFRWNFRLMASKGYVVVAPNRRGLPGFGQAWNDQISGDWGGQCMQDLLSAVDDVLTEPWADRERVGAVGASFGGYTAYWLMGNGGDRFRAIIAHCGVFNLESMYASTEELWFVNWDLGGPYWRSSEVRAGYEAFSPHRFVGNWKTPLLVIHGEKDFRVPINQGLEAFTAAQIEGVPSRFLYFPQEGHWVLSPQNGVLWQRVFFDWLDRHLKAPK